MNLDEMLKALEVEAKESGEKTLADARAQAKEILDEAKQEGQKLAQSYLDEAKAKVELERTKIISAANFFVKKEALMAQEEVITKLFSSLKEAATKDGLSPGCFKQLAEEALVKFKGQKVSVMVNSNDKVLAEKALNDLGASFQLKNGLDAIGGLRVESENGQRSVDNTIDSRLKRIKQLYEPQIALQLFGEKI